MELIIIGGIILLIIVIIAIASVPVIMIQEYRRNKIYKNSSYEAIIKKPEDYDIEIINDNDKMMIKAFFVNGSCDNLKSLFLLLNHFEKEGWKIKGEIKDLAALKMHYVMLEKVS